jgi:hypothetical protein
VFSASEEAGAVEALAARDGNAQEIAEQVGSTRYMTCVKISDTKNERYQAASGTSFVARSSLSKKSCMTWAGIL